MGDRRGGVNRQWPPDATDGASLVGPEAIAAGQSESLARFRATHHVSSDHVIDLEGDSAPLRANLIAMHLWVDQERDPNTPQTHFVAGGVLRALVVRTGRVRRLSDLSPRNTWRTGSGYAAMLATGRQRGRRLSLSALVDDVGAHG
ncbi:nuclear transport factor 2 family protein [Parafrankia discariae]|uniref:nuclear transport factor 2 family protein n=1 Tax=Parafrankia discariae TaxID=365528 RepID=UPI0038994CD1